MEWEFDSDVGKTCNSFITVTITLTDDSGKKHGKLLRIPKEWFDVIDGRYAIASIKLEMMLLLDELEEEREKQSL